MNDPIKIAVLICTYNRSQTLRESVESVATQTLPPSIGWEILVVDNNSKDDTRQVVEALQNQYPGRIRYLFEPQQGLSFARNAGIREARGEIVAFIDDDEKAGPNWLQNLTANLHDGEWAGSGGRVLPPSTFSLPHWISTKSSFASGPLSAFDLGLEPGPLNEPAFGANMAFRKEAFDRCGGFRTDLGRTGNNMISNEDTEFGRRLLAAGLKLRYEPAAVTYHPVEEFRLRKEYFLSWWFNKGRSDVREAGIQSNTRRFCGIPPGLFLSLPWAAMRWMLAIQAPQRFGRKLDVWNCAGQILESYHQWLNAKQKGPITAVSGVHSLALPKTRTIAFVTNTGEYGGSERHLLDLVRRLIESGVRVSILSTAEDLYSKHLTKEESTRIVIIRCRGRLQSFRAWYRIFRDNSPDVVVFVRAWLWCYQWYVPLAAWLAGVPRRMSIAHLPPVAPPKIEGGLLRQSAARCRRIAHHWLLRLSAQFESVTICVSNAIRDSLIKDYGFPIRRTITIPNGVLLPDLQPGQGAAVRAKLGLSSQEFLVVCIARLNEQKRIDILLLAIAQLVAKGVPCKCVIVGDGPLRKDLADQASALGLDGKVFFEGFQVDPIQYLRAGTAFVLTSSVEGLPLALLEAMACGLPCIATNVGGNAEALTDRVHGLMVPAGSADEVAAAIEYFSTHPAEREEMGRLARARVREEFDIQKCMERIKDVILG